MTIVTIEKKSNAAERFIFTASDEEVLDDLDVLVKHATQGDGEAVGAVAIGFGPMLGREARAELGALWARSRGRSDERCGYAKSRPS